MAKMMRFGVASAIFAAVLGGNFVAQSGYAVAREPSKHAVLETAAIDLGEDSCSPTMTAMASSMSMVDLSVVAPCHTSQPFIVHHQGMMATFLTDPNGHAEISVPALAYVSVMIATFPDREGAVATVSVPDFAEYDRTVLQWQGDRPILLRAAFDDARFITESGILLRLGGESVKDARIANVYIVPVAGNPVGLLGEAKVTHHTCGVELNVESIQVSANGVSSSLDMTLTMPDCASVGETVMLPDLFGGTKLALK